MYRRKSRGQAMVEFALLSGLLFLLVMGIFDFGRAIAVYISSDYRFFDGPRELVLRSNYSSTPADSVIINATLAKIGGGEPVLSSRLKPSTIMPAAGPSWPTTVNTGYI